MIDTKLIKKVLIFFLFPKACPRQATLLFIVVLVLANSCSAFSSDDLPESVSTTDGCMSSGEQTHGPQAEKNPAIIFLPGILGSKISRHISDKEIDVWGHGPPDASSLVFDPKAPSGDIRVSLLDKFALFTGYKKKVYGSILGKLEGISGLDVFVFPYDWRRDIREIAEVLDDRLHGRTGPPDCVKRWDLRDRDVFFVAHSMGGLVAWWWQQIHYSSDAEKQKYPFRLQRIILLGTPLKGSCDMIRMFVKGYEESASSGNEALTNVAYREIFKIFFSDLKPAALNFPSVFQLLPLPNELNNTITCFRDATIATGKTIDYFNPVVWKKSSDCDDSDSQCNQLYRVILKKKPWERTGLSEDVYMQRLIDAARAGGEFRKDLKFVSAVPVTLFGCGDHPTVQQMELQWESGYTIFADIKRKSGDGRVLYESAAPIGQNFERRLAHSEHGALIDDSDFLENYININLRELLSNIKANTNTRADHTVQ